MESVNELLGEEPREQISSGVAVKAMILSGLSCVSAPLYLFSCERAHLDLTSMSVTGVYLTSREGVPVAGILPIKIWHWLLRFAMVIPATID